MAVIAIVDYEMGNLHSVCKGLEKTGATPKITDYSKDLERADAVVDFPAALSPVSQTQAPFS